MIKGMVVW